MKKYLITDAITEQITLQEAKDHLRIFESDEDTYIDGLISTARKLAETATSNYYGEQTVKIVFSKEDQIDKYLELTHPYKAMTSVKIDGVDFADYSVRDERIVLDYVPTFDVLEIIHTVGKDAPSAVKSGMLLLIGHLYENREATTTIELGVLPIGIDRLFGTDKVLI